MSKRNIHPNSGKQLYLNQIFYKGMLYTSSEMREGFAKVIDNYDIAPTGDAASPRQPLVLEDEERNILSDSKYVVPVKFKQDEGHQDYVSFHRTITEQEFAEDIVSDDGEAGIKYINISRRPDNALNDTVTFDTPMSYFYPNKNISDPGENRPFEKEYKLDLENLNFGDVDKNFQIPYIDDNNFLSSYPIYRCFGSVDPQGVPSTLITVEPEWIIDGDTFKIYSQNKEESIRLYGVDAKEDTSSIQEWGPFATEVLKALLTSNMCLGITISKKGISYNRTVAKVYAYYKTVEEFKFLKIDVAEFLLECGLATIKYIDTSKDPDTIREYVKYQNIAVQNNRKIYNNSIDYDPLYNAGIPGQPYIINNDNLVITENMYVEAVRLNNEFNISAKTTSTIDFVQTTFIDYLDGLGFIGRIIEVKDGLRKVYYKGLIILQAKIDESTGLYFNLLMPTNKGNGFKPDIMSAISSNSHNLNNSNMINLDNPNDPNKAFRVDGTLVVSPIPNPQRVVVDAPAGQEVLLKALINADGKYYSNDMSTTDNYGLIVTIPTVTLKSRYKIPASEGKPETVKDVIFTLIPEATIQKSPNELKNILVRRFNLQTLLSNAVESKSVTWEDLTKIGIYSNATWNSLLGMVNTDDGTPYITLKFNEDSFSLLDINNSSKVITIAEQIPSVDLTIKEKYTKLFSDSLLEVFFKYDLKDDDNTLEIKITTNFSSINKTYGTMPDDAAGNNGLVNRSNIPSTFLFSQWSIKEIGSDKFTPIQDEQKLFEKKAGSATLIKLDGDPAWSNAIFAKPCDLLYTIPSLNPSFKFSIKPKFYNKIGSKCPKELELTFTNKFQELYYITPALNTADTPRFISDADLRQNMDFKNATRLDIFNRQICLYGPYTKSNVLFFSKFEKFDYFPFPASVIEVEEPITFIKNYKDSLVVFGQNNIFMLGGAITVPECSLFKIYENLSIHLPDIRTVNISGNNLIFFNNGVGYVMIPNIYVDNTNNVRIYKLTEYINNFFYNPEAYIRNRFASFKVNEELTFKMDFQTYVQNNNIFVLNNINIISNSSEGHSVDHLTVWMIYNQDYKYWRMYSTKLFDKVIASYICEPNFNTQFVTHSGDISCIAYFASPYDIKYKDIGRANPNGALNIKTMINSGYLSVDTMNDKRFKDIIIELDNINPEATLNMQCEFFIDGAPMILSNEGVLIIDLLKNQEFEINPDDVDDELSTYKDYEVYHLGLNKIPLDTPDVETTYQKFGKAFIIDNKAYSITGRTHVRIPVYGKGRLPSFILKIDTEQFYEFINYSVIYKEKNINRRS